MKTRMFVVLTALLIMVMAGSAMCTPPDNAADRVASQAEQKAIDALQKAIDAKGYNWTAGVTSVSGLTDDEKKKLCGVKPINDRKDKDVKVKKPKKTDPVGTFPTTFDWHNKDGENWMTPVKGQGSCGSCWAFSVVGVVEAAINIYANDPNLDIDLSEQHLVSDCCSAGDCGGGQPYTGLAYIRDNGVPEESCFPYIMSNCACTPCDGWEDNNWWTVDSIESAYTRDGFKSNIQLYGPLMARMPVYSDFYCYSQGVYQHTYGDYMGQHAIIVVGWNETESCWIIKNSWGAGWGEDGYARISYPYVTHTYGGVAVESMNWKPVAEASANTTCGISPLTVAFTGTGTDSDGTVVSYTWTFGDGASSTAQNPTHTYTSHGTYTATLIVTDDDDANRSDSIGIIAGGCNCDLTGDNMVNNDDISEIILNWGACSGCWHDLNDDGFVNSDDIIVAIINWGPCCNPHTCKGDFDYDGDRDLDDYIDFSDAYGSEVGDSTYNAIGDFDNDMDVDLDDFIDFQEVYGISCT